MADRLSVDVLVIGSGASGLAAAVSADKAGARVALVTKGALQSCNSAKAQGGIQAAFGADDSPEQHAEDVWKSSHETANRRLVEVLTSEGPSAIGWLEQVGDRTGHAITSALRDAVETSTAVTLPKAPLTELAPTADGWRATCGEHSIEAATVVLAAGGRCYAEAEQRGELSTNHPGATGEVTSIALELG